MPQQKNFNKLSAQTLELAQAAPQVISMRLGQFAKAGLAPKANDVAEFNRMFLEKQHAFFLSWQAMLTQAMAVQGQLAASFWQATLAPWSLAQPTTSARLMSQWQDAVLRTANAGIAPVRKKAAANAKRLSARQRRSK